MAVTTYTTAAAIQQFLGVTTPTAGQLAEAGSAALAATAMVDRLTHRTWQNSGTVLGEQHGVEGAFVYLVHRPIASITAMNARSITVGAPPIVLVNLVDYELLDAQHGVLSLMNWWDLFIWGQRDMVRDAVGSHMGKLLSVDYTTTESLPDDIARAATLLGAIHMFTTFTPSLAGVKSVNISGALQVQYDLSDWQKEADRIMKSNSKFVFA